MIVNPIEDVERRLTTELIGMAADVRARVRGQHGLGAVRTRADGDITHSFDADLEARILKVLESASLPLRFSSEEREDFDLCQDPDFVAIVDPLDGSSMLARGYPLAAISICIARLEDNEPVLSLIQEVFTDVLYSASNGVAQRDGQPVAPSRATRLGDAFLVTYAGSPSRMHALTQVQELLDKCAMVLNYGGPLDVAKVGSGQCDVMLEFSKGFAPRDLLAGLHFAQCAGAKAAGLDGTPLKYQVDRESRTRFVVAGSAPLLDEVLGLLLPSPR